MRQLRYKFPNWFRATQDYYAYGMLRLEEVADGPLYRDAPWLHLEFRCGAFRRTYTLRPYCYTNKPVTCLLCLAGESING